MEKVSDKPIKELLSDWGAAVGKTLASVGEETADYDDVLVFRFTDGTAIVLRSGGDDSYGCFRNDPETYGDDYGSDRRARVYFGLESLEEYERDELRRAHRRRVEQHDAELMMYERLKRKFGAE